MLKLHVSVNALSFFLFFFFINFRIWWRMWQDHSALPQKGLGWHGISPGSGDGKESFFVPFSENRNPKVDPSHLFINSCLLEVAEWKKTVYILCLCFSQLFFVMDFQFLPLVSCAHLIYTIILNRINVTLLENMNLYFFYFFVFLKVPEICECIYPHPRKLMWFWYQPFLLSANA